MKNIYLSTPVFLGGNFVHSTNLLYKKTPVQVQSAYTFFNNKINLGHNNLKLKKSWHNNLNKYYLGDRNNTVVFDSKYTSTYLIKAVYVLTAIVQSQGNILIINTNPELSKLMYHIKKNIKNNNIFFSDCGWTNGMLTNWSQVYNKVKTFVDFYYDYNTFLNENNIHFPSYKKMKKNYKGFINNTWKTSGFSSLQYLTKSITSNTKTPVTRSQATTHILPIVKTALHSYAMHTLKNYKVIFPAVDTGRRKSDILHLFYNRSGKTVFETQPKIAKHTRTKYLYSQLSETETQLKNYKVIFPAMHTGTEYIETNTSGLRKYISLKKNINTSKVKKTISNNSCFLHGKKLTAPGGFFYPSTFLPLQENVPSKNSKVRNTQLNLNWKPDLLVFTSLNNSESILKEARAFNIPTIGFVDSNSNVNNVIYQIPVNTNFYPIIWYFFTLTAKILNKKQNK